MIFLCEENKLVPSPWSKIIIDFLEISDEYIPKITSSGK